MDGLYAQGEGDIAVLFGVAGYRHAESKKFTNSDDVSALAYMRRQGASVRVTAQMPVVSSKNQMVVVRRGQRPNQSFAAMLALTGNIYRHIQPDGLAEVVDVQRGSLANGELRYRFKRKVPGREPGREQTAKPEDFIDIEDPAGGLSSQDTTVSALAEVEARIKWEAQAPGMVLQSHPNATARFVGSGSATKAARSLGRLIDARKGRLLPAPDGWLLSALELPSATLLETRRDLQNAVLASLGVPPGLPTAVAGGASVRESYRRIVRYTVEPLVELASEELADKLGLTGLRLDPKRLHGADMAALARAMVALTGSGLTVDDAISTVGIDDGRTDTAGLGPPS